MKREWYRLALIFLLAIATTAGQVRAGEAPMEGPTLNALLSKASQEQAAGNAAGSEDFLRQAATVVASKEDSGRWAASTWEFVRACTSLDESLAAFGRLSLLATTVDMTRNLADSFIGGARQWILAGALDKGTKLLAAVKNFTTQAGLSEEFGPPIGILEQLALAQACAQANQSDASISALAAAVRLAAGNPVWENTVYEASISLAFARAGAKDKAGADAVVAFVTREPMLVDPWRVHIDVAYLQRQRQEFAAAEAQLVQAAALLKSDGHAACWAESVAALFGAMKLEDAPAAFSRLAALATTSGVRQCLARSFLNLARRQLVETQYAGGQSALNAGKSIASEFTELAQTARFLDQLALAQKLAKDADGAGAVQALLGAQGLAKSQADWMNDLYNIAHSLAYQRMRDRDNKSSAQFAHFLTQGCGTGIEPWTFHTSLARLNIALGDLGAAEANVAGAAPLIKTDDNAGTWSGLVWQLVSASKELDDGIASLRRLASLGTDAGTKSKLAETVNAGTRYWLLSGDFLKGIRIV